MLLVLSCLHILFINAKAKRCTPIADAKNDTINEPFEKLCDMHECVNDLVSKDCIEVILTDSTYAASPQTQYYEFGEYLNFQITVPTYDNTHDAHITYANLTYVHLDLIHKDVVLFSPRIQRHVKFNKVSFKSESRFRGSIYFNDSYLGDRIDGRLDDLTFTFTVGRHKETVVRGAQIGVVAKRCMHKGANLASPNTYVDFPCNRTLYPNATEDAMFLRFCDVYGWDDRKTRDFCDPQNTEQAVYTQRQKSNNAVEVFILLFVVISLVVFMSLICYFVYKTFEESFWESSSEEDSSDIVEYKNTHIAAPAQQDTQSKVATAVKVLRQPTVTGSSSLASPEGKRAPGQLEDSNETTLAEPVQNPEQSSNPTSIVQSLAMLAKLRDVGDVTAEEFGLVKNMILYE